MAAERGERRPEKPGPKGPRPDRSRPEENSIAQRVDETHKLKGNKHQPPTEGKKYISLWLARMDRMEWYIRFERVFKRLPSHLLLDSERPTTGPAHRPDADRAKRRTGLQRKARSPSHQAEWVSGKMVGHDGQEEDDIKT